MQIRSKLTDLKEFLRILSPSPFDLLETKTAAAEDVSERYHVNRTAVCGQLRNIVQKIVQNNQRARWLRDRSRCSLAWPTDRRPPPELTQDHHCSCTLRQKSTFLLPRLNTMEPKRAKKQKSRTQSVKRLDWRTSASLARGPPSVDSAAD